MTTDTADKRSTQKLQRAIVDALEDVKAQDIRIYDTELLSALFERVVIASGTSNRQTKALASSVLDAVRAAGFPKPRVEGEANGEWIIVDCGRAVVHIMQPHVRQYYHLEELWGDKPVRLRHGAPKPGPSVTVLAPTRKAVARKTATGTAATRSPAARPSTPATTRQPAGRTNAAASSARAGAKRPAGRPGAKKPAGR